jgi:hypothetical protein
MKMKLSFTVLLSVLSAASAAAAPSDFSWRQEILDSPAPGRMARAQVTAETWDGCEWAPDRDLRIYDGGGAEWPFFTWTEPGDAKEVAIPATRINEVEVQGMRQFELELGGAAATGHDKIRVVFDGKDYMRRTEIFGRESENDAWGLLGAGFLVRIPKAPVVQEDIVAYSRSTFKHLMVRVHPDPRRPEEIVPSPASETMPVRSECKPEPRDEVVLSPCDTTSGKEKPKGMQLLEFKSGLAVPLREIEIRADGEYSRDVRIYCKRHETNGWQWAGSGRISRIGDAEFARIPVDGAVSARWRVDVEQLDDAPLENVQATGRAARTWLVFEAKSDAPAHVFFGDGEATRPRYDISRRVKSPGAVGTVKLGPRELNPEQRTRRAAPKWLIPAGVGLAAVIMLLVIVNMLRDMSGKKADA